MIGPILFEIRAKIAADLKVLEECGPGPHPNEIATHVQSAREAELRGVLRFIDRLAEERPFQGELAELIALHEGRAQELRAQFYRSTGRLVGAVR